MSQPAWYPDPAGQPHTYRFWDGQRWSEQTTTNPYDPPPGTPPPPGFPPAQPWSPMPQVGGAPSGGGRRTGLVIGGIVLALLLVGGGVAAAIVLAGEDEGSDQASEEETSETTEPSQPSTGDVLASCPTANPAFRTSADVPGRVVGGGISYARIPGFDNRALADQTEAAFTWLYDVDSQAKYIERGEDPESGGWISQVAVGQVRRDDGYTDVEQAAESLMHCMATSETMYDSVSSDDEVSSERIEVDGHDAWAVRHEIRVDRADLDVEGDVVLVIVVDTGDEDAFGVFSGVMPLGNDGLVQRLDDAAASLSVD